MAKKNKNKNFKISFTGQNNTNVTGSCILVEVGKIKILLECGLYQGSNTIKDYQINSRKFKFKPKNIDYVFLCHAHADHSCLIPKLYKEGFKGKIITTEKTAKLIPLLFNDSAYIIDKTAFTIGRIKNKYIERIYTVDDVEVALENIIPCKIGRKFKLNENVMFEFIPNNHIIGASSLKLYLTVKGRTDTVLYTSDIGNNKIKKPFVTNWAKDVKADYVISECTYANPRRQFAIKDYVKDIEKIKTVVSDIQDNKGRVLIPAFSLDRTQYILSILYKIYGQDDNFKIPIIIDSPLSTKITKVYDEVIQGEDRELLDGMLSWKNVRFISDVQSSKACLADKSPKIVISASGMLQAGRSRKYLKEYIEDSNNYIVMCGYCVEGTLGWQIKNNTKDKIISIDGKKYKNNCKIVFLKSMSSHIQHDDLLEYLSNLNCERIFLVHGDMKDKIEFAKILKESIRSKNKTTRVVVVNRSTKFIR